MESSSSEWISTQDFWEAALSGEIEIPTNEIVSAYSKATALIGAVYRREGARLHRLEPDPSKFLQAINVDVLLATAQNFSEAGTKADSKSTHHVAQGLALLLIDYILVRDEEALRAAKRALKFSVLFGAIGVLVLLILSVWAFISGWTWAAVILALVGGWDLVMTCINIVKVPLGNRKARKLLSTLFATRQIALDLAGGGYDKGQVLAALNRLSDQNFIIPSVLHSLVRISR